MVTGAAFNRGDHFSASAVETFAVLIMVIITNRDFAGTKDIVRTSLFVRSVHPWKTAVAA